MGKIPRYRQSAKAQSQHSEGLPNLPGQHIRTKRTTGSGCANLRNRRTKIERENKMNHLQNSADDGDSGYLLEFPHFVTNVLTRVEPRKLSIMATYLEMPVERMLRNAYTAEKSPADVERDVEHFWTHKVH